MRPRRPRVRHQYAARSANGSRGSRSRHGARKSSIASTPETGTSHACHPQFHFFRHGPDAGIPGAGPEAGGPIGGSPPRPLRRRIATCHLPATVLVPLGAAICRALGVSPRGCSAPVRSFNPRVQGSSPRRPTTNQLRTPLFILKPGAPRCDIRTVCRARRPPDSSMITGRMRFSEGTGASDNYTSVSGEDRAIPHRPIKASSARLAKSSGAKAGAP